MVVYDFVHKQPFFYFVRRTCTRKSGAHTQKPHGYHKGIYVFIREIRTKRRKTTFQQIKR